MRVLLVVIAAISLTASVGTCTLAKGAPHEIEAQIWFLIFVVAGCGSAVLDLLQKIREGVKPVTLAAPDRPVAPDRPASPPPTPAASSPDRTQKGSCSNCGSLLP